MIRKNLKTEREQKYYPPLVGYGNARKLGWKMLGKKDYLWRKIFLHCPLEGKRKGARPKGREAQTYVELIGPCRWGSTEQLA
jgi:hypothetical protein